MGTLEEIRKLQQEGMSDQQIMDSLKQQGIPLQEITNYIAQAKIKQAVNYPDNPQEMQNNYKTIGEQNSITKSSTDYDMQSSIMDPGAEQNQPPQPQKPSMPQMPTSSEQNVQYTQPPMQEYESQEPMPYPDQYAQQNYQAPQQNYSSSYDYAPASETISEIAEQIVFEKISPLKEKIKESLNFKSMMESRLDYLESRLLKIEKIIDRLQLSVLQKVGDYITNVEDIKKELIETQKTFKSIQNQKNSTAL